MLAGIAKSVILLATGSNRRELNFCYGKKYFTAVQTGFGGPTRILCNGKGFIPWGKSASGVALTTYPKESVEIYPYYPSGLSG